MDSYIGCCRTISFDDSGKLINTPNCQLGVGPCSKRRTVLQLSSIGEYPIHMGFKELQADEIRLLVLCPAAERNSPVQGYLLHTSTSGRPAYSALSWVWGDQNIRKQIFVDEAATTIPANLLPALQSFRHERKPIILWIDTICIDQTNIAERNRQVRLMEQTYASAESVLAWLGPATDTSTEQMRKLDEILYPPQVQRKPPTGMQDVLNRTWWTRMWVVQELLLSKQAFLCIGSDRVRWPNSVFPAYQGQLAEHNLGYLMRIQRWMALYDSKPCILRLFTLLQGFDCTDPRDRVFAILSLVDKRDALANAADYSLSVQAVQQRLVKTSMKCSSKPTILSYARGAQSFAAEGTGDPSWVPIWGKATRSQGETARSGVPSITSLVPPSTIESTHIDRKLPNYRRFAAASTVSTIILDSFSGPAFRGIEFDTLTSEILSSGAHWASLRNNLKIDKKSDLILTHDLDRNEYPLDCCELDCARCLLESVTGGTAAILDRASSDIKGHLKALIKAIFADSKDTLFVGMYSDGRYGVKRNPDAPSGVLEATHTSSKALFRTRRDKFVLASRFCKPGDIVCIIFGARVPFILRRTDSKDSETYLLLGEAYVQDAMDGQILSEFERQTRQWSDNNNRRIGSIVSGREMSTINQGDAPCQNYQDRYFELV